jgi:hypothetical protein
VPKTQKAGNCPICLDPPTDLVALHCGHAVCYPCLRRWLNEDESCPLCRAPASLSHLMQWADGFVPFWFIPF